MRNLFYTLCVIYVYASYHAAFIHHATSLCYLLHRYATGEAPLFGIWAYGFWQCKEHYHNQTELLDAASQFRQRQLPVDNIVQDWQYWGKLGKTVNEGH